MFCPEHAKRDQKSEICTPKRDDEHPHLFQISHSQVKTNISEIIENRSEGFNFLIENFKYFVYVSADN